VSGKSFRIDVPEVRSAAHSIRRAVDDLDLATRNLEAAVRRVSGAHYGADPLGRALQGEGSGVGGLAQHQERVLQGIRKYLDNSSQMSDNLLLMCEQHAQNDAETAARLRRILETAQREPTVTASPMIDRTVATSPRHVVRGPLEVTDVGPGPIATRPLHIGTTVPTEPAEPLLTSYHDPDQPDLQYNDRAGAYRSERPVPGGGGAHPMVS
jgi:hypothetical protein